MLIGTEPSCRTLQDLIRQPLGHRIANEFAAQSPQGSQETVAAHYAEPCLLLVLQQGHWRNFLYACMQQGQPFTHGSGAMCIMFNICVGHSNWCATPWPLKRHAFLYGLCTCSRRQAAALPLILHPAAQCAPPNRCRGTLLLGSLWVEVAPDGSCLEG